LPTAACRSWEARGTGVRALEPPGNRWSAARCPVRGGASRPRWSRAHFSIPTPMGSPAGLACFACRVLDFVIIPDVICGSIAVCHHRSRLRPRTCGWGTRMPRRLTLLGVAPGGFGRGATLDRRHRASVDDWARVPVCAEGGGRFAGCVRGARFWGQLRGGSHDDGPDGAETDGSARIEWVRGGQLPTARSPRVCRRRRTIRRVRSRGQVLGATPGRKPRRRT